MVTPPLIKEGRLFIGTKPYPFKMNDFFCQTHLPVLHHLNWERLFEKCEFENVKVSAKTLSLICGKSIINLISSILSIYQKLS